MGLTRTQTIMVAVFLAGTVLAVLNQTLLSPALPAIMADLGVDATTVQWLTSGYSLTEAVIIPFAAYFIGRFSTRQLFLGGMTLFTLGSLQFGSCVAGLCAGAGVGLVVLFRTNHRVKENLAIVGTLYACSVVTGMLVNLIF